MPKSDAPAPVRKIAPTDERDRQELIRFKSAEARLEAIGALVDYGMLSFTSYSENDWLVRTPVARLLRKLGVPFEWLTENV